ncbi:MAG TPA: DUF3368 domain-containing protein [Thermomicrobiales bacterium]|jgi:predicted nucleic acid-binding protein
MVAVSDSSPLILYSRIGRFDLLRVIFGDVVIPPAVWQEVVDLASGRAGEVDVATAPWIRRQAPLDTGALSLLAADLGPGEAEAIVLAREIGWPCTVILDDLRARRIARRYGLTIVGSAGLLPIAKRLGAISTVAPVLIELKAAGLYLSAAKSRELLASVDEGDDEQRT